MGNCGCRLESSIYRVLSKSGCFSLKQKKVHYFIAFLRSLPVDLEIMPYCLQVIICTVRKAWACSWSVLVDWWALERVFCIFPSASVCAFMPWSRFRFFIIVSFLGVCSSSPGFMNISPIFVGFFFPFPFWWKIVVSWEDKWSNVALLELQASVQFTNSFSVLLLLRKWCLLLQWSALKLISAPSPTVLIQCGLSLSSHLKIYLHDLFKNVNFSMRFLIWYNSNAFFFLKKHQLALLIHGLTLKF